MKWTIGKLAREAGIPVSTLRYYEREALLQPGERSGANYRLYAAQDLERLRFIRAAQAVGFTIADIKTLLKYRDGLLAPCNEVSHLIEGRLSHIQQRMKEFRQMQRVLNSYLSECHEAEQDDACHVIEKLDPAVRKAATSSLPRRAKKNRDRT